MQTIYVFYKMFRKLVKFYSIYKSILKIIPTCPLSLVPRSSLHVMKAVLYAPSKAIFARKTREREKEWNDGPVIAKKTP